MDGEAISVEAEDEAGEEVNIDRVLISNFGHVCNALSYKSTYHGEAWLKTRSVLEKAVSIQMTSLACSVSPLTSYGCNVARRDPLGRMRVSDQRRSRTCFTTGDKAMPSYNDQSSRAGGGRSFSENKNLCIAKKTRRGVTKSYIPSSFTTLALHHFFRLNSGPFP